MPRRVPRLPHVTRTWPRWTLALSLLLGACGLLWAGESARLGGCTPRAPRTDEGPMDAPLVHAPSDPNAEREVTGAVALEPSGAARSACEAACEDVFWPEATGFAPAPRRVGASLRALPGARGWWVDAAPDHEHSALLCVENEPPELECPWVMPLAAMVPWGGGEVYVQATLGAAEALLEITLHPAANRQSCVCPLFDLRARAH